MKSEGRFASACDCTARPLTMDVVSPKAQLLESNGVTSPCEGKEPASHV